MAPKRAATYTSANSKAAVWSKAKPIRGKNPDTHRQDPYGNTIVYSNYGKTTPTGWQKDHIKPSSRGGSDHISNLQALQSHLNMSKGNSLVKKSRHNN